MKNKIEDLRNILFETLDDLRDKEKPMDIKRAKAIAGVAQVIVDSAKAENDFIRLTGSKGSGFIPKQLPSPQPPVAENVPSTRVLPAGNGKGRLDLTGCPDPNCGGTLRPQTNGSGGLKDVCDKCHRTPKAASV